MIRPWLRTILKVAVMGATMCSGIIVAKYDVLVWDEGGNEGQDIRQTQRIRPRSLIDYGLERQS